jgi:hypothetical protein
MNAGELNEDGQPLD